MFPIFVCLGKLRVECQGCHGNILFLKKKKKIRHMGPTYILEATANSFHAGSYLGALSASGVMGDSFFGDQGHQGLYPLLTGKMPP